MIALITGASSGIGKDFAKSLAKKGYSIIAVARDETRLQKAKQEIQKENEKIAIDTITMDLSNKENCIKLYEQVKQNYGTIDLLINNAGFGDFGSFTRTSLEKEMDMIQTNIVAVHILTKLFLKDMVEIDKGQILNVASIAGFMPGPLMATYYASKAYVVRLTQAIHRELRKQHANVFVSLLCPGPVKTNFNDVANVKFELKGHTSSSVVAYTLGKLKKHKVVILPGIEIKAIHFWAKVIPDSMMASICYHMQKKKEGKDGI